MSDIEIHLKPKLVADMVKWLRLDPMFSGESEITISLKLSGGVYSAVMSHEGLSYHGIGSGPDIALAEMLAIGGML